MPYQRPTEEEKARRHTQLLKLHQAVGASILTHGYVDVAELPTKGAQLDYTLGADAKIL